MSPTYFVLEVLGTINTCSQRARKIIALTKMTANRVVRINEEDNEDQQGLAVTSQEDSDESDRLMNEKIEMMPSM